MSEPLGFQIAPEHVRRMAHDEMIPKGVKQWLVDYCKALVDVGYEGPVLVLANVDIPGTEKQEEESNANADVSEL